MTSQIGANWIPFVLAKKVQVLIIWFDLNVTCNKQSRTTVNAQKPISNISSFLSKKEW